MGLTYIAYTTLYRDGGSKFRRVAETMAKELREQGAEVRLERLERKAEFVRAMERIKGEGRQLDALHLVVHAGMYGPMFGTTKWPEQLSPHEWRALQLPFSKQGEAFFHACRSARWFAPFFARTQGVPAHGYHWYTAFSLRPDKYVVPLGRDDGPLYVFGCPGGTSHGLGGTLRKYSGLVVPEQLKRFEPHAADSSYDPVADLYDEAWRDIRHRRDEWAFVEARVAPGARVLDMGCGNGALLRALLPRIDSGVGLDRSKRMIELARRRGGKGLRFEAIDSPMLPVPDKSIDVVVSMLSFRYLDWDPWLSEVRRVLVPEGRLIVVDMVAKPVATKELPRFALDRTRGAATRVRRGEFGSALRRLVSNPRWGDMLSLNPIRAEHEFRWYLESRFPGRRAELLNIGYRSRVLAFDSGPIRNGVLRPSKFP